MPKNPTTNIEALLKKLPEGPVLVAVADIDGVLRGKRISKAKLKSALKSGLGFCNVVFGWDVEDQPYDNTQISGWHTGYPDAEARLDPNTLRQVPWDGNIPFLLGDFDGGIAADACPRTALKRVLAKAEHMGYAVNSAIEYEWFTFAETPQSLAAKQGALPTSATPGMHGYSMLRPTSLPSYTEDLWTLLGEFGIPLEGLHTETGPGVYEAAIHYTRGIEAADRAACFKLGVKQLSLKHDLIAGFMAKWTADLPGCSGHFHQSLSDLKTGENLFSKPSRKHGISKLFDSYLAGQLYWLPKLLPFFAPTVNSYKRLVEGSWAATSTSWGLDNRTTAFRVIGGGLSSTRLETRIPGADANPYLVMAAGIAAGLYGIENKLTLKQSATKGNAYAAKGLEPLPTNLSQATQALKAVRKEAGGLLGQAFIDHFIATREWEWRQSEQVVTDWERRRYLEII
ncbi:MAG: glutamine synthetase family protein [Saprospiraceae bacterium]